MARFPSQVRSLRGITELSDSDEVEEIVEESSKSEPLEVKVVKEKEKVVNEDIDYEEFDIEAEEIKEFENGK